MENLLKNKIDFVYIFDVKDGNPNGDPDAGNMPRIDAETNQGLVSDGCLKRKVRNYIQLKKNSEPGFDIFIKEKSILINAIDAAYNSDDVKLKKEDDDKNIAAVKFMCQNFYDVRTFGAVMTRGQGKNSGQVKGPIQLTFSRSIDPILAQTHTITRCAVSNVKDEKKGQTMGTKYTVPYGLYVCHGFVSSRFAQKSGFTEGDLELFWDALKNMWNEDHSAARGLMTPQKLIVFRHESDLGNVPADKLFHLVHIKKIADEPARDISDYEISIDKDKLPDTIKCEELI